MLFSGKSWDCSGQLRLLGLLGLLGLLRLLGVVGKIRVV